MGARLNVHLLHAADGRTPGDDVMSVSFFQSDPHLAIRGVLSTWAISGFRLIEGKCGSL